jgi:hypothetical protein
VKRREPARLLERTGIDREDPRGELRAPGVEHANAGYVRGAGGVVGEEINATRTRFSASLAKVDAIRVKIGIAPRTHGVDLEKPGYDQVSHGKRERSVHANRGRFGARRTKIGIDLPIDALKEAAPGIEQQKLGVELAPIPSIRREIHANERGVVATRASLDANRRSLAGIPAHRGLARASVYANRDDYADNAPSGCATLPDSVSTLATFGAPLAPNSAP